MKPDYHCPVCHTLSGLVVTPTQAFCTGGDECPVLMFDPSLPDGGMSNATFVDLLRKTEPPPGSTPDGGSL